MESMEKLAKSPMEESANRLSRPGDRMSPRREGHELKAEG